MSSTAIVRLSSIASLLVGVLMVVFNLLSLAGLITPTQDQPRALFAIVLSVFAITGIYAVQAHRAGVLGLVGYMALITNLVLNAGVRFIYTFINVDLFATKFPQVLEEVSMGSFTTVYMAVTVIFVVGYLLFGVATLRSKIFPWGSAALLMFYGLYNFLATYLGLPPQVGSIAGGISLIWFGLALWAFERKPTLQPHPAV